MPFLPDYFRDLIDHIFSLPESILELMIDKMLGASNLVAQGLDVSKWLAPIGLLGPEWTRVINALLGGAGLVITFYLAKRVYALYIELKAGVKWW